LSDVARTLGYTTKKGFISRREALPRIAARHRTVWQKPLVEENLEHKNLRLFSLVERDPRESLKSHEPVSVHQSPLAWHSNDGYLSKSFRSFAQPSAKSCGEETCPPRRIAPNTGKGPWRRSAPTLAELSRRWPVRLIHLAMHEPDLCNQLLVRYRKYIEERRCALRKAAESALEETPVPSLRSVCERLGITVWCYEPVLPDVRRRITEQHRRCSLAETAGHRKCCSKPCVRSPQKSTAGDFIPQRPESLIVFPGDFRCEWMTLNAAVRQAQSALGISISNQ